MQKHHGEEAMGVTVADEAQLGRAQSSDLEGEATNRGVGSMTTAYGTKQLAQEKFAFRKGKGQKHQVKKWRSNA